MEKQAKANAIKVTKERIKIGHRNNGIFTLLKTDKFTVNVKEKTYVFVEKKIKKADIKTAEKIFFKKFNNSAGLIAHLNEEEKRSTEERRKSMSEIERLLELLQRAKSNLEDRNNNIYNIPDYLISEESKKIINREFLVNFLVEFFCEDGIIQIGNLDFPDSIRRVYLSGISGAGDLDIYQSGHKNKGCIYQSEHTNSGEVKQKGHANGSVIEQGWHKNSDNIYQEYHSSLGDVVQGGHSNIGDVIQDGHSNDGIINQSYHCNKKSIKQCSHVNVGDVCEGGHKRTGDVYQIENDNSGKTYKCSKE